MRWMLFLALSCFSLTAFSASQSVPNELDKAYVESLKRLSTKLTECQRSEQSIDISDLIAKGYEKPVIKKVIAYHYAKAKFECSQNEYEQYLVLSNAYGAFLPSEGVKQKEKIDALVSSYEKYRWQAIQDYAGLPEAVKAYAASVDALQKPFELFAVIDQLNEI